MTIASSADAKPLSRDQMAARVARDIPEGWYVNLGTGAPIMVANHVPLDYDVIFHSENGVLGAAYFAEGDAIDPWLVNAGGKNITLRKGAAFVHHADSFGMVRGNHINCCVLGAYEVAENGDLANWSTGKGDRMPAIGGAMDLAAGVENVWVVMEHVTKTGAPRLVQKASYPLTSAACVKRVYTNLAVIDVMPKGFVVREMIAGMTLENLQAKTGAKLHLA